MKHKVFFLVLLFFLFPVFSQSNKITFSIFPYTGLSYGCHYEHLYSGMGKENEVSLLEWKIEPLWTFGADATLKFYNLFIELGADYALPINCGEMHDSDFEAFSGMKYCYSINELKSKQNIHTHFDLAYFFNLSEFFILKPKASVHYYYDSFEARNGYGWYGMETKNHPLVAWDDPRAKYYSKGQLNGVDFYRHTLLTFFGLGFSVNIQRISIDLEMLLSPYTYFYTMDTHLSKNKNYHLKEIQQSSFNQYLLECNIRYKLTDYMKLYFALSYIDGSTSRGKLYNDYITESIMLSNQKSGASLKLINVRLGPEFSF